jgi:hypothetical protein
MCGSDLAARAGMKSSDRYSVPLCSCHALLYQFGEWTFGSTLRIDPLNVAFRLWTVQAISRQARESPSGRDSGLI